MNIWAWALPAPVALATVALIGYLMGRKTNRSAGTSEFNGNRELRRAENVIRELESISREVRRNLASHHASILRFKERINQLGGLHDGSTWQELSDEAERVLKPTLKLSTQIAHAYDEIRQQTNMLMLFTEVRTDPLTGLSNRRGMEETLNRLFALNNRYHTAFTVAMLDLDHFKSVNDQLGHLQGDQLLREFSSLLADTARETDLTARYGGEEFIVVMPQTDLLGACVFCERLRQKVERQLGVTVSIGVTQAQEGDSLHSLLSRADAALYGAKAHGRNCVFRHTGQATESVAELLESASGRRRAGAQSDIHAEASQDARHSHFPAASVGDDPTALGMPLSSGNFPAPPPCGTV